MSTKIRNGFLLVEGTDLAEFKRTVRTVIDPLRDQEDLKLLAVETAKYVDASWLAGEPVLPGAAGIAYSQWAEAQSKMSVRDFDHDENRFELSIGTDPGTGRIMVIAFTENHALLEAFEGLPQVEEYGYWDSNNFYPDGVTEADWKVRKAAWDRMLPGLGRPSDTMESWILRDTVEIREELRGDTARIIALAPSPEDRADFPGKDAYANYLRLDRSVELMKAVRFVVFGRGQSVRPVIDTVASFLPPLTAELLTEGSGDAVIDPGYKDAVAVACAALYEQDKDSLEEDH